MSISFRVSHKKEELNERIVRLKDILNITVSGHLLEKMIETLEQDVFGFNITERLTEKDKELYSIINCVYLGKEGDWFVCYERMESLKKSDKISKDRKIVFMRCMGCQKKKDEDLVYQQLKRLLKYVFKISRHGEIHYAPICSSGYSNKISKTGKFVCPLYDYKKTVDINEYCKKQINPDIGKPPCQFFIEVPHISRMRDTKEWKEIIGDSSLPSPEQFEESRKVVKIEQEE